LVGAEAEGFEHQARWRWALFLIILRLFLIVSMWVMARPLKVEFAGALYHAGYPSEKNCIPQRESKSTKGQLVRLLSLALAG